MSEIQLMEQRKQNILVTKKLRDEDLKLASDMGLNIHCSPVLDFSFPSDWSEIFQKVNSTQADAFVFTSQNGVRGFSKMMEQYDKALLRIPEIFAVGDKTKEALKKLGIEAVVSAESNATSLARFIINRHNVGSVIHFCGTRRRPELAEILEQVNISVTELIVYETTINPEKSQEIEADAVLFYSPSAVKAFYSNKDLEVKKIPGFAIGPTTADALKIESIENIITADKTSTEALFRKVRDFFTVTI